MSVTLSDIAITGLSTDQEINAVGNVQEMTRVYYNIGEYGPYNIVIPKLELSAQRVLMDVRRDAQQYVDILNLTF